MSGLFVQWAWYVNVVALRIAVFALQRSQLKHFKAIAAMSENRVIGRGNQIPWHLPEDFRWFKQLTTGNVIVMGRKTFESIGRPLPNRTTIVISRIGFSFPGVATVADWRDIDVSKETRDVFICGGAQIYSQTLTMCSDLYLTVVKRTVEGDAFFPPFEADFELVEQLRDAPEFRILHYANRRL
ncbi:MAG: dihydrofolate reductase [Limisphaerales bacterium]